MVVALTQLAGEGAGGADDCGAAEDRGWEDDAERDATDHAPLEPGLRAVVGGLLDLQLAVRGAVHHDDALDLDGAAVLDGLEGLIGLPRRAGVAEVGDEEGVGAVGDGGRLISRSGVLLSSDMGALLVGEGPHSRTTRTSTASPSADGPARLGATYGVRDQCVPQDSGSADECLSHASPGRWARPDQVGGGVLAVGGASTASRSAITASSSGAAVPVCRTRSASGSWSWRHARRPGAPKARSLDCASGADAAIAVSWSSVAATCFCSPASHPRSPPQSDRHGGRAAVCVRTTPPPPRQSGGRPASAPSRRERSSRGSATAARRSAPISHQAQLGTMLASPARAVSGARRLGGCRTQGLAGVGVAVTVAVRVEVSVAVRVGRGPALCVTVAVAVAVGWSEGCAQGRGVLVGSGSAPCASGSALTRSLTRPPNVSDSRSAPANRRPLHRTR